MPEIEDANTRYFVDLDLKTRRVLDWDYGQRSKLSGQELMRPFHHRIFMTKGQYNKLVKKHAEVLHGNAVTR